MTEVKIKQEKIDIDNVVIKQEYSETEENPFQEGELLTAPGNSNIVKFEITEIKEEEEEEDDEPSDSTLIRCDLCLESFISEKDLKIHTRFHYSTNRRFICLRCPNRDFASSKGLIRHSSSHLTPPSFRCSVCKETFTSKLYLKSHKTLCGKHKCDICDSGFSTKELMENHKKKWHYGNNMEKLMESNQKPLICRYCGKIFTEQTPYEEHLMEHQSKVKKFCSDCNTVFKYTNVFDQHPCRNRPGLFTCNYCIWAFPDDLSLRLHRMLHSQTPAKCSHCPKQFIAWKYLKIHILLFHRETVHVVNEKTLENLPQPTEPELGQIRTE